MTHSLEDRIRQTWVTISPTYWDMAARPVLKVPLWPNPFYPQERSYWSNEPEAVEFSVRKLVHEFEPDTMRVDIVGMSRGTEVVVSKRYFERSVDALR